MKGCIEEGVLQAYADGELPAEAARAVAAHLAGCAACSAEARDASAEFADFARIFSVEEPLSVPTERLRASIAAAVSDSELARAADALAVPHTRSESAARDLPGGHSLGSNPVGGDSTGGSFGGRLRAFASSFVGALAPRQAAAFAGLALAALLAGVIFYTLKQSPDAPGRGGQTGELAAVKPTPARPPQTPARPASQPDAQQNSQQNSQQSGQQSTRQDAPTGVSPSPAPTAGGLAAGGDSRKRGGVGQLAKIPPKGGPILDRRGGGAREAAPASVLLPVEREYAAEIASLRTAIERQGASALSPTLRAEYERSLAVVDQAIVASRDAARTNPRDADAQEFLRTAYRDKLDLLSAVADRAQLAGLER